MKLFSKIFKSHSKIQGAKPLVKSAPVETKEKELWESLPEYIDLDERMEETELVSIISAAAAAGGSPCAKFEVKKVMEKNPEVELVSIITACLAARDHPDNHFIVKRVLARSTNN